MSQMTTIEVADGERTRFLGERVIFIQILALNDFQLLNPLLVELNGFRIILL